MSLSWSITQFNASYHFYGSEEGRPRFGIGQDLDHWGRNCKQEAPREASAGGRGSWDRVRERADWGGEVANGREGLRIAREQVVK